MVSLSLCNWRVRLYEHFVWLPPSAVWGGDSGALRWLLDTVSKIPSLYRRSIVSERVTATLVSSCTHLEFDVVCE